MSDEYEGFSNYETWCVHTWILKDKATREKINSQLKRIRESASTSEPVASGASSPRQFIVDRLADVIRKTLQDDFPLADFYSVYSDLLQAALGKVNQNEIAESLLSTESSQEAAD